MDESSRSDLPKNFRREQTDGRKIWFVSSYVASMEARQIEVQIGHCSVELKLLTLTATVLKCMECCQVGSPNFRSQVNSIFGQWLDLRVHDTILSAVECMRTEGIRMLRTLYLGAYKRRRDGRELFLLRLSEIGFSWNTSA